MKQEEPILTKEERKFKEEFLKENAMECPNCGKKKLISLGKSHVDENFHYLHCLGCRYSFVVDKLEKKVKILGQEVTSQDDKRKMRIKNLIQLKKDELEMKKQHLLSLLKKRNSRFMSAYFDTLQDIKVLKAQLQFAKKLIKAIKVDVDKIVSFTCECHSISFDGKKCKACGKSYKYGEVDYDELNKILDEALK